MAVLYYKNFTNREFVLRQGCHVTTILEWMLRFEGHLIRTSISKGLEKLVMIIEQTVN